MYFFSIFPAHHVTDVRFFFNVISFLCVHLPAYFMLCCHIIICKPRQSRILLLLVDGKHILQQKQQQQQYPHNMRP